MRARVASVSMVCVVVRGPDQSIKSSYFFSFRESYKQRRRRVVRLMTHLSIYRVLGDFLGDAKAADTAARVASAVSGGEFG